MKEGNISEFEIEEKLKKPKILGIIMLLLAAIFTVTYFINDTFKVVANDVLEEIPVIGRLVSSKPTMLEINEREDEIARYYLEDLDPKSSADKLYIIKREDSSLYNRLIRRMSNTSSERTDKILDEIRNIEIRSDYLNDIYQEVQDEKTEDIKEKASQLESIGTRASVDKIMEGSEYEEGQVERLFLHMSDRTATDILYYLDGGTRSDILYKLSEIDMKRKNTVEKLYLKKRAEEAAKDEQASKLANIYTSTNPEEAASVIGTDEEIELNILARTFMMMPEKPAAEILVKVKDEDFLNRLYAEIEKEETLRGIDQSSLVLISQIRAYLIEYGEKLDKLAKVYQRMNSKLAADSLLELLSNQSELTVLQIRTQEGYQLSDYTVAVDLMRKMRDVNLKDVFEKMESDDVARITRILSER